MSTQVISHHPGELALLHYSSGNLALDEALCLSVHLEHCPQCQAHYRKLMALADVNWQGLPEASVDDSLKVKVLERIKRASSEPSEALARVSSSVPHALRKWVPDELDQLAWRAVTKTLSVCELTKSSEGRKVALVKVAAGGKMPHHSHSGNEVTVVLQGSFSDEDGRYMEGDYIVRKGDDKHTPIASKEQPCICLTLLDGPIQLTGFFSKLLNPLLKLQY